MSKAILPQEITGLARNKKEPSLVTSGGATLYKGRFSSDPRIRQLRDEGLNTARGAFREFGERADALRARYEGNSGALMEARTRPVTQMVNRNLQSLGNRGLGGSSFYGQAATSGATAIGDARSQAEMETLEAISGIDKSKIAAAFSLASQLGAASSAEAAEMFQGLGLGLQQAGMMAQLYEQFLNRRQKAYEHERSNMHDFGMAAWEGFIGSKTGGSKKTSGGNEDSGLN